MRKQNDAEPLTEAEMEAERGQRIAVAVFLLEALLDRRFEDVIDIGGREAIARDLERLKGAA